MRLSEYRGQRYWFLHALRQIRAAVRVHGSGWNAKQRAEQKKLQKELAKLKPNCKWPNKDTPRPKKKGKKK